MDKVVHMNLTFISGSKSPLRRQTAKLQLEVVPRLGYCHRLREDNRMGAKRS